MALTAHKYSLFCINYVLWIICYLPLIISGFLPFRRFNGLILSQITWKSGPETELFFFFDIWGGAINSSSAIPPIYTRRTLIFVPQRLKTNSSFRHILYSRLNYNFIIYLNKELAKWLGGQRTQKKLKRVSLVYRDQGGLSCRRPCVRITTPSNFRLLLSLMISATVGFGQIFFGFC